MAGTRWNKKEIQFLKENYSNNYKEYILKVLTNRNWNSILLKASQLNIKKRNVDRIYGDLSILLEEHFETYYWVGFILADGSICNNRLTITLHKKDLCILEKFAKYIKYKGNIKHYGDYITICIMDSIIIPLIKEKFSISKRKTYNPPDVNKYINISNDKLMSLLIGFIDGDGCIQKQYKRNDISCTIKGHISWINFISLLNKILSDLSDTNYNSCFITKCGRYYDLFLNTEKSKLLKQYGLDFSLPVLKRKWDKVDLNFTSKQRISKQRKIKVKQMLKDGYTKTHIANILNISKSTISAMIRRNYEEFKEVNYYGKGINGKSS